MSLRTDACAYCGGPGPLTRDHVIPKRRGGRWTVPACGPCNHSKGDERPLEWYRRQPFFSAKRWARIVAEMPEPAIPLCGEAQPALPPYVPVFPAEMPWQDLLRAVRERWPLPEKD